MIQLERLQLPRERYLYTKAVEYIYDSQQNSIIPDGGVPLCVPSNIDYHVLESIGASKCLTKNTWYLPFKYVKQPHTIPYLPLIYRYDLKPPFIMPNLVPQSIWGVNLHSILPEKTWKEIKHKIYQQTNYICTICGGKGPDWPIECNEVWEYITTDEKNIAKLVNLIGLCPHCHRIQHLGKANVDGVLHNTVEHMGFINCWEPVFAQKKVTEAFHHWEKLSQRTLWEFDFKWFNNYFGITVNLSKNKFHKLQPKFINSCKK